VGGRLPYDVMRMRSALIVGMAGAVLALSGCWGDDDSPSTLPSATGGASESGSGTDGETPSVTPTADPSAALQAELEAFFRDYTDAINESFSSAEAAEKRRSYYSTTCSVCISGQRIVDDVHTMGQVFEGGRVAFGSATVTPTSSDQATVLVVSDAAAGRILQGGTVVREFPVDPGFTVAYTARRQPDGNWLIIQGEGLQ